MRPFQEINRAYNSVFQAGKLSVGIVIPIENYAHSSIPSMTEHLARVKLLEDLDFRALWVRDVPFQVPSFGDAGQMYDPFTYLGFLAAQTSKIALGVSSIALPLHHPVHVAKSAATIDQLSNGRLILGVASGDRPDEYPAMNIDFDKRGELFRDAFAYIRNAADSFPSIEKQSFGEVLGTADILPKPMYGKIPMLITGYSQQSLDWNAEHGDGWMYYPRNLYQQQHVIREWREMIPATHGKPFMQPLYVDLHDDPNFRPEPIHLGFRIGSSHLVDYLMNLQEIGVNHVAINLRFNHSNISKTLETLAEHVLPHFHTQEKEAITE